jgi:hypothetical protein
MKRNIFWDVTQCSPVEVQPSFRAAKYFNLQGRKVSQASSRKEEGGKESR